MTAFLKTMLMTVICFFGFIVSPFAFPAVLVGVFVLWSTPYILAVVLEHRREQKAAQAAAEAAKRPVAEPPPDAVPLPR